MTAHSGIDQASEHSGTLTSQQVATSAQNNSTRHLFDRFGIQTKATVLAAIFGVLPVLVVGVLAYRVADESIVQKIGAEKIAEAEQLSNKLSIFLQDRLANTKTFVRVVDIVTGGNLEAIRPKQSQAQANPKQLQVQVLQLENELTNFVQDYPVYSNISVYDLQGGVIVQSRGSAQEPNQKNYTYFQQVLKTELPAVSEPTATNAGSSAGLAIYVAAPIKDRSGKTTSVLVAKTPVEFVGNAIFRTSGSQKHIIYHMIDSSGQVFQHFNEPGNPQLGNKIASEISLFPKVIAQRKSQAWIENTDEGEQLHTYAPLRNSGNLNWSIVTSTDTAIAFAAQRQLLQTIALGTVATAVMATVLAAILANRAIRPILQATAAVEKLGQGELDTRLQTQGSDELAALGTNINQMAERIQNLLSTQRQNAEQLVLQNDVLSNLAQNEGLLEGNATTAARAFTEATAQTLAVAQVSVWLYNLNGDALVCVDLYQGLQEHKSGMELKNIDFPAYFQAIEQERLIVVDDALTDPATREFSEYLKPLGIVSILGIPIRIAGKTVGVVCCEHTKPRQWKPDEQSFVSSVANLISLALESELLQQEVGHLLEVVSAVEEGDFTTRAQVSDKTTGLVADTFNRLLEQLGDVLAQVLSTAQSVSAGSSALGQLAETVVTNAQQQEHEVVQVLSLTEQVEQSAQSSTVAVKLATQLLLNIRATVEQGQVAIDNMTGGIDVLQQGTDRIIQRMKALGEFVGLADQFVQDQSQIASLTQVLALNATLVAARASEQRDPRRFSVVAREFEAIAAQVSDLAQQTNEGLTSLQQRTDQINTVVSAIDTEVQSLGGLVSGFTTGVDRSNQVFGNVRTITGQVVQAGEAVAQSSQEIVSAAQSTAKAMHEIADFAARTAILTKKARRRSEGMEMLSSSLLDSIRFFRLADKKRRQLRDTQILHSLPTEAEPLSTRSQAEPGNEALAVPGTADN